MDIKDIIVDSPKDLCFQAEITYKDKDGNTTIFITNMFFDESIQKAKTDVLTAFVNNYSEIEEIESIVLTVSPIYLNKRMPLEKYRGRKPRDDIKITVCQKF